MRIDAAGALQEVAGSRILSGFGTVSLAISPDGRFVYMEDPYWRGNNNFYDNAILGYSFDPLTGVVASMTGSPFADNQSLSSVAVSPKGTVLPVTRINAPGGGHVASYRIDPVSGALTPISGTMPDSGIPTGGSPNHVLVVPRS